MGTIAAEDGTAVGLAVEFLRASGDPDDVQHIGLEVIAQGDLLLSAEGPLASLCLAFAASGRVSLLAQDGKLDASSRILLLAHHPSELAPDGGPPAKGAEPDCSGSVIDDAVWPTRGAQVIPVVDGTGGAGGSGGAGGGGGGGASNASGSGGQGNPDAGDDEPDAGTGEDAG